MDTLVMPWARFAGEYCTNGNRWNHNVQYESKSDKERKARQVCYPQIARAFAYN